MHKSRSLIETLAEFASATRYEDIPERVVEKVKLQIITSITAAKFSDWHPEAYKVFCAERDQASGPLESTVIALNQKLAPSQAAVVNAAYAMRLDFDDYMLMGHTGYSSVLTGLAYLESCEGLLKDLILAASVTNELTGRLALTCFIGPLNGQMWSYIHNLGAAVCVGKVRGLDRKTLAHAMSLALYQPNFCLVPGFWTEGSKLLTASIPLRAGISAALYAEEGLKGPLDILEGHMGFFHFFSFCPVQEFMGDLGMAWLCDSLSYKRYPGTSYIGAPVDAALAALRDLGLQHVERVDSIRKIEIDTTFLSYSLESVSQSRGDPPKDPIAINFSVRYSVAYALLRGDLLPEHFHHETIRAFQDKVEALSKKIHVRHDWTMTAETLSTFPQLGKVLFGMSAKERRKIIEHLEDLSNASASVKGVVAAAGNLLLRSSGKTLLKGLWKGKGHPIRLMDVHLPAYRMLQSARVTLHLEDGRRAVSEFRIPTGGSGTDWEARKEWVAKRLELAFGKNPSPIFTMMRDPEVPVRRLVAELLGSP